MPEIRSIYQAQKHIGSTIMLIKISRKQRAKCIRNDFDGVYQLNM